MPRLSHGATISVGAVQAARDALADRGADVPLGFAAALPVDTQDFDFLLPELQNNPDNLLPASRRTRDDLVRLGKSMRDVREDDRAGDSRIPAVFTYFGQFVDHDVTLEAFTAAPPELLDPDLTPLPLNQIRDLIRNSRTATFDLDSVYGIPAPRLGAKMRIGQVTPLGGTGKPLLRPPAKTDDNDLPREPRNDTDPSRDRAALIGDPRNDENTIVAQLHLAFLLAHNALVNRGMTFQEARRTLRQHYQHIVLRDFLPRIAEPTVVADTIKANRVYDALAEPFFLPLEFSVAAYRFGHSMARAAYDFNLNFNLSGEPNTFPATFDFLFTFTALSGQLGGSPGFPGGFDTLPDNWIVEWENLVDAGGPFNRTRRIDTRLVEPLSHLRRFDGTELPDLEAHLAVRNLLRGYLLRMPTGQAVARALRRKLSGVRNIPVLTAAQIEDVAAEVPTPTGEETQLQVVQDSGFARRTPLWYYLLAEAAALANGQRLGPVGSTLVAEVLVGLVRRSEDSILRTPGWKPTLPRARPTTFALTDLLRLAGVLPAA